MYQEIPDSRLIEALKSVGLDRYANIPALDSVITEHGSNFSGGEKKRICLARALLRDTDVLILDEPLETWMLQQRNELKIFCYPFKIKRCWLYHISLQKQSCLVLTE